MKTQLQTFINTNLCGKGYFDIDLTSFTLSLRHDSVWNRLVENEEPIVWNQPVLDEYWNRFEEEIDRREQLELVPKIEGIHFENVEITKERLAAIVDIFRDGRATNSSTIINFVNTNLCGEGIAYLSKLVNVSALCMLYLYHNRIDSMESARCLFRSMRSHPRINHYFDSL